MQRFHLSMLALLLMSLASVIPMKDTQAQESASPQSDPSVWQDIMKTPRREGAYGSGFTSTQRIVERCTALEWSIRRKKDGSIRKYRRNYQTGYCLGWINSAMAFLDIRDEAGKHTLGVCIPDDMDSVDIVKILLDDTHKDANSLKYNPSLLIYKSLLENYPCKQ